MTNLNEFDKSEWLDVYRAFLPNNTPEQFEADWIEFQAIKSAHLAKKLIQ